MDYNSSDLKRLTMEIYEKLDKIGKETYVKVYKAKKEFTSYVVALKKTRFEMDEELAFVFSSFCVI